MSKQFLIECFESNHKDILKSISNANVFGKKRENFDYVTIIPKYGRDLHFEHLIKCLKKRKEESSFSHRNVVVEHSENPDSKNKCIENDIDYIHIPKGSELFNKCLCMNVGSFLHNGNYFHFHDVDLWIPPQFWKKIERNINGKFFLQAFTGRRVNYIDEAHTSVIFKGRVGINEVIAKRSAWKSGKPGAPGGSVIAEKNLFNSIGGFDPSYFVSYSIEDQFFIDKIQNSTRFFGADNPPIEMFHLWHPSNEKATPIEIRKKGLKIRDYFIKLNKNEKQEMICMYKNFLQSQREAFDRVLK